MKLKHEHDERALRRGAIVFAVFVIVVGLLGGSSRADAVQIVALRPIAAVFLIPIIYYFSANHLTPIRAPLTLLGLLGGWMVIQMIPLPPAMWQSLPGTEPITALSQQLGAEAVWRPISFVPFRTLNAFASLIVPAVALLLPAILQVKRQYLFYGVIAVSTVSAFLGIIQIFDGSNSPLYLYQFTNRGSATGLLANRNHGAVLMSLAMVTAAYLLTSQSHRPLARIQRIVLGVSFLIVFVGALITGSRAGFLTALIAIIASVSMLYLQVTRQPAASEKKNTKWQMASRPLLIGMAAILILCLVLGSLALSGRVPAIERLFAENGPWQDLRLSIAPTLVEMMRVHFVLGTGFGSFEDVYHIYEPAELLFPAYVNMAHNDWAQLLIEAGLPGAAILTAFAVWVWRSVAKALGAATITWRGVTYWMSVFVIIAVASVVDYPLRTPLFQAVAAWLLAAFCAERAVLRRR